MNGTLNLEPQKTTMNCPIFVVEFLELYKSLPAVWKLRSREYSDRQAKAVAYKKLEEKLREVDPQANRESVVRKINNLRTSYRRELKKVQRSKKSGGKVYKPGLWYYPLMGFIEEQETFKLKSKADANDSDDTDEIIPLFDMPHQPTDPQPIQVKREPGEICDSGLTFDTKSEAAESADSTDYHMLTVHEDFSAEPVKIIGASPVDISFDCKCWLKERRDQSTECNMLQSYRHDDDEFDAIGKTYAYKLKGLSNEQRIYAEKLISDVLFEAQLGGLTRNSVFLAKSDNLL